MAKKDKAAPANDVPQVTSVTGEAVAPAKVAVPRSRGPRGTEESAKIHLVATANPKRASSKAHEIFAQYVDGMTIKEFADRVDLVAKGMSTTALVYDAKHGFITIEGYDAGEIVVPKERAPARPKAEKVKKVKDETAAAETKNETMD